MENRKEKEGRGQCPRSHEGTESHSASWLPNQLAIINRILYPVILGKCESGQNTFLDTESLVEWPPLKPFLRKELLEEYQEEM